MNYYSILSGIIRHLINISSKKDISFKEVVAMCFHQIPKNMAVMPNKRRNIEMQIK